MSARARSGWAVGVLAAVVVPCLGAELVDALLGVDPYRLAAAPDRPPSLGHPLGTDALGRDALSRLLHGGRISLFVAVAASVLSVLAGAAIGAVAGLSGGRVERLAMRVTEAFMALPKLPLVLVLASMGGFAEADRGPVASALRVAAVIAALSWMDVARLTRTVASRLRSQDFLRAAEALGLPRGRILLRHGLPHLAGPLGVAFALEVSEHLLFESALSFLGLGLAPPTPSWGRLLAASFHGLLDRPWMMVIPGLLTAAVAGALQVGAEALRSRLDPGQARDLGRGGG